MSPTEIIEYSKTEAALADLAQRYKGVVFDVTTRDGMKTAIASRAELRKYRTDLEKTRKEIKEPALRRSQQIDSEARRITAELAALEDPIDAQIKKEEERKELERTAAARAEAARIEAERAAAQKAEEDRQAAARAEIARLQAEIAEQARAAREKIEADQRAARERIEAEERAARAAREDADRQARAERDRIAAEAKEKEDIARAQRIAEEDRLRQERDRLEAAAKAEREAAEAKARVEREAAEAAAKAERDRVEKEERERIMAEQERVDGYHMLRMFCARFLEVDEFAQIVIAISAFLEKRDQLHSPAPKSPPNRSQASRSARPGRAAG